VREIDIWEILADVHSGERITGLMEALDRAGKDDIA
jgi:hypothetical protein